MKDPFFLSYGALTGDIVIAYVLAIFNHCLFDTTAVESLIYPKRLPSKKLGILFYLRKVLFLRETY